MQHRLALLLDGHWAVGIVPVQRFIDEGITDSRVLVDQCPLGVGDVELGAVALSILNARKCAQRRLSFFFVETARVFSERPPHHRILCLAVVHEDQIHEHALAVL